MDTGNFNFFDKTIAFLRLQKVIKLVEKNDIILDFGCGSQGYFLKSVSKKIGKGIGIDYDVKNTENENLEFIKQKFSGVLSFKKEVFDKVFLLAVLEHIPEKLVIKLFEEFNRVLKKDGLVVLTTPTSFGKNILEFLAYKLHIISEGEIRDHKKYYSKQEIFKLAGLSGFRLADYKLFQFGINSRAILKKIN
ncbi:MAG: class I SAM-dependent methyltransferase [Candidatus Shapirobacteria bacterium]|nr:class I SAM-dependent methyltransferase [Candidatus Shapirobacteria bacterium]